MNAEYKNVVIVDDDYTGACAEAYAKIGNEWDDIMGKYVAILKGLVDNQHFQGAAADLLYEFAAVAEGMLGGIASQLGSHKRAVMERFIEEIDEADKEIY